MKYLKAPKIAFPLLLALLIGVHASGQDTIPAPQADTLLLGTVATDTMAVDTMVIRDFQYPVRSIPRGVTLRVPKISFNATKPLTQPFKRFRIPSFWAKENELDLQFSEVAFVNWNAGGDNSVSANARVYFGRNYKFGSFQWDNDLELRFGWNAQEGRKWRKTDDAIRLSSTIGYRPDTLSHWFYSVKLNFNTQFADGFKYPDRSRPISRLMAPGYLFFGAGTAYVIEEKKFNLYFSPVTFKGTFVLDQDLADRGAFGVEKAVLDANGNVLTPGSNLFAEMGMLLTHKWEVPLVKNVTLNHNLTLFSDYLRVIWNVDVDWQLKFNFKVNEYISANLFGHLIYDDDILFDREVAQDGTVINEGAPRTQFRQQLGIGINYKF